MIWLSWRQLRVQAAAVYAVVAAVAVLVLMTGPKLRDLASLGANVFDQLTSTDFTFFYAGTILLALAPALIGAFWGAPLVARELEAGTHRLVWNQSVTRSRWLANRMGVAALVAAAATGLLALAITWWAGPIDGLASETHGNLPSRLTPVSFAMRGIAPVGYTVFAVVLGVAVGLVMRRSLPAMAVTLALFTIVQVAVPLWVRPHLISPVEELVTISGERLDGIMRPGDSDGPLVLTTNATHSGDWVLTNETVDSAGHVAALPSWFADCVEAGPAPRSSQPGQAPPIDSCLVQLDEEGYQQRMVYQPADRFWALQGAETGVFLAMSGVLAGFCFWWIRRRLS